MGKVCTSQHPGICPTSTALITAHSNSQFSVDIPAWNPIYRIILIQTAHSQSSDLQSQRCYQLLSVTPVLLVVHMWLLPWPLPWQKLLVSMPQKTFAKKTPKTQGSQISGLKRGLPCVLSSMCFPPLLPHTHLFAFLCPLYHTNCTQNQSPRPHQLQTSCGLTIFLQILCLLHMNVLVPLDLHWEVPAMSTVTFSQATYNGLRVP